MPKICVCIEPLFGDASLAKKARLAARAGFSVIEFWCYDAEGDRDLEKLAAACAESGVSVNDIVVNSPNGSVGGALVRPADRGKYLSRLREVIGVAQRLDCRRLITCSGNTLPDLPRAEQHQAMVETLKQAAAVASQEGVTLVLEPLNSLVDHAGYYLDSGHEAAEVIREVGSPSVRLLWDVYHMQIMHGNVIANIAQYLDLIGHFHSAGVPGRHELDTGELDYRAILAEIKALGYEGAFGLEYYPATGDHQASLARMRELTASAGWD